MKWDVHENDPDLMGGTVLVDGDRIHEVYRINTEEGWVEANCVLGGDLEAPGTCAHGVDSCPDPEGGPGERIEGRAPVCSRRFRGEVEVYGPDGEKLAA